MGRLARKSGFAHSGVLSSETECRAAGSRGLHVTTTCGFAPPARPGRLDGGRAGPAAALSSGFERRPVRSSGTECRPVRSSGTECRPVRSSGFERRATGPRGRRASPTCANVTGRGADILPCRRTGPAAALSSGFECRPVRNSGTEQWPVRNSGSECRIWRSGRRGRRAHPEVSIVGCARSEKYALARTGAPRARRGRRRRTPRRSCGSARRRHARTRGATARPSRSARPGATRPRPHRPAPSP